MGVEVLTVLRHIHIKVCHLNLIAPDVAHRALSTVLLKWLIHVDNDSVITSQTVSEVRPKVWETLVTCRDKILSILALYFWA